jgi:hypothetical protein
MGAQALKINFPTFKAATWSLRASNMKKVNTFKDKHRKYRGKRLNDKINGTACLHVMQK